MAAQHDTTRVFLTKEESERIKHTVKDRLKRCSELAGRTREPRDSKDAISQATGASLMADMGAALGQGQSRDETLPALAVGQPYAPCVISVDELQPMALTDLQMDTHDRHHRLTVKRVSPVVTLTARSWTMVQDEAGVETERLEMSLHTSRHGKDILESAYRFIIKEPYFTLTDQGEATLRIDHPSDLIICWDAVKVGGASSADGGKDSTENLATAEKLAIKCKDQGNAALGNQNLALAHARYTQGLEIARQPAVHVAKPDLAQDLFRNRAHVNLLLNQLDEAKTDAESSLTGGEDQRSKDLDSKAYFRAGSAAYTLGLYAEARRFFEERLKRTPDDKYAKITLRRIETRLREQETGKYELKKIQAGLSQARPRTDAASFISNTKIGDSPGRGRGLFSTRNLAPGGIIMCEKAFCVVWGHESEALTAMTYDVRDDRIRVSPVGLSKSIVQKLASNPSQITEVMGLYGDYEGSRDTQMVDTFRVHDIVSRNAFSPGSPFGQEDTRSASTGLWVRAAYINHSCIANAEKEYIGDLMVLRAIQQIASGEELFLSYVEPNDYDARQAALMATWGFECDCSLCSAEKTDDASLRRKRRDLISQADDFVRKEPWSSTKRITIAKAQRLGRALEDTYAGDKYKGIPHLATERIQEWIEKANSRR